MTINERRFREITGRRDVRLANANLMAAAPALLAACKAIAAHASANQLDSVPEDWTIGNTDMRLLREVIALAEGKGGA